MELTNGGCGCWIKKDDWSLESKSAICVKLARPLELGWRGDTVMCVGEGRRWEDEGDEEDEEDQKGDLRIAPMRRSFRTERREHEFESVIWVELATRSETNSRCAEEKVWEERRRKKKRGK